MTAFEAGPFDRVEVYDAGNDFSIELDGQIITNLFQDRFFSFDQLLAGMGLTVDLQSNFCTCLGLQVGDRSGLHNYLLSLAIHFADQKHLDHRSIPLFTAIYL